MKHPILTLALLTPLMGFAQNPLSTGKEKIDDCYLGKYCVQNIRVANPSAPPRELATYDAQLRPSGKGTIQIVGGVNVLYGVRSDAAVINMKMEQHDPGRFAKDVQTIQNNLKGYCENTHQNLVNFFSQNPDHKTTFDKGKLPGDRYMIYDERINAAGQVSFVACHNANIYNNRSGEGQLVFIDANGAKTITAYILEDKENRFKDIQEVVSIMDELKRRWLLN
jgi:hypothetical protein